MESEDISDSGAASIESVEPLPPPDIPTPLLLDESQGGAEIAHSSSSTGHAVGMATCSHSKLPLVSHIQSESPQLWTKFASSKISFTEDGPVIEDCLNEILMSVRALKMGQCEMTSLFQTQMGKLNHDMKQMWLHVASDAAAHKATAIASPSELEAQLATFGYKNMKVDVVSGTNQAPHKHSLLQEEAAAAHPGKTDCGIPIFQGRASTLQEPNTSRAAEPPQRSLSGVPRRKVNLRFHSKKSKVSSAEGQDDASSSDLGFAAKKSPQILFTPVQVDSSLSSSKQESKRNIKTFNDGRMTRDLELLRHSSKDVNRSSVDDSEIVEVDDVVPTAANDVEIPAFESCRGLGFFAKTSCPLWTSLGSFLFEIVLVFFGLQKCDLSIIPPCLAAVYPLIPLLLNIAFLSLSLQLTSEMYKDEPGKKVLVSDIAVGCASVLVLFALGPLGLSSSTVSTSKLELYRFAHQKSFIADWALRTTCEFAVACLTWTAILIGRMHSKPNLDMKSILDLALFGNATGTLLGAAFCILHFSTGLRKTVDDFIVSYVQQPAISSVVRSWGIVTAHLRLTSARLQWSFVVLGAFAMTTVLVSLLDVHNGHMLELLPTAILVLGLLLIFLKAASVTETCATVPTLVNEFAINGDLQERLLLVQHIHASNAGLHYFGASISVSSVQRFTYFTVVSAVTVASRIINL